LSIDLDTTEGRKKYLSEKLDDLLDGINESYGKLLLDELIARLELTVKDFNEEMKVLVDQLVKKEQERQQILEMMKSTQSAIDADAGSTEDGELGDESGGISDDPAEEVELTEWEKKLEKIEKGN